MWVKVKATGIPEPSLWNNIGGTIMYTHIHTHTHTRERERERERERIHTYIYTMHIIIWNSITDMQINVMFITEFLKKVLIFYTTLQ